MQQTTQLSASWMIVLLFLQPMPVMGGLHPSALSDVGGSLSVAKLQRGASDRQRQQPPNSCRFPCELPQLFWSLWGPDTATTPSGGSLGSVGRSQACRTVRDAFCRLDPFSKELRQLYLSEAALRGEEAQLAMHTLAASIQCATFTAERLHSKNARRARMRVHSNVCGPARCCAPSLCSAFCVKGGLRWMITTPEIVTAMVLPVLAQAILQMGTESNDSACCVTVFGPMFGAMGANTMFFCCLRRSSGERADSLAECGHVPGNAGLIQLESRNSTCQWNRGLCCCIPVLSVFSWWHLSS